MPTGKRGLDSPAMTGLGAAGTRHDAADAHAERGLDKKLAGFLVLIGVLPAWRRPPRRVVIWLS